MRMKRSLGLLWHPQSAALRGQPLSGLRADFASVALWLAGEGRLDYLKLLLESYRAGREAAGKGFSDKKAAKLLNRRNLHGQTPLMLACKHGWERQLLRFRMKSADVL